MSTTATRGVRDTRVAAPNRVHPAVLRLDEARALPLKRSAAARPEARHDELPLELEGGRAKGRIGPPSVHSPDPGQRRRPGVGGRRGCPGAGGARGRGVRLCLPLAILRLEEARAGVSESALARDTMIGSWGRKM